MFKQASKMKLKFESNRGLLSVEDLWEMPLTSKDNFDLDTVAKNVNRQIKESEEESFVSVKSNASTVQALRLDIVKAVIQDKLTAMEEGTLRVEKADKRKKILAAIADKQDASITDKSLEELQADLKELDTPSESAS